ncbi:MAG: cupin domain-containing protein [Acidobacteria bacterium]|nr:cupin domain-containing protein [Acidobacteriota bacterium]
MMRFLKVILSAFAVVGLYLLLGIGINTAFPTEMPDLAGFFKPGDRLVSRFEGFDQTVLEVGDGWLHTRLEIAPNAAGPPEHFHEHFGETFTVKSGTLSVLIDGEKKTLHAGETIHIPPMTPHKPFNETNEIVVVEGGDASAIPIEFAYILTQMYGFMDEYPNGPSVPAMLMQLSVYGDSADSWLADGPPLPIQKAMRLLMAPTARLLGFSYHYPKYVPQRN